MRLKRFFWIAPTTLLLIVSQTFRLNFPVPLAASPVVAQTSDVRKAEADRLLGQGLQQHQTSQFQAAIQSGQQALVIYREIGDRKGEGNALVNLGDAYRALKDYTKAIEYLEKYLATSRELKDREGEMYALGNLGILYASQGNPNRAIEYYRQPLAIEFYQQLLANTRRLKARQGEGLALAILGIAYDVLGDYTTAIEYYQQRIALARERKDRQDEAHYLGNLGHAHLKLGNYIKAVEEAQQGLALARELKDPQKEVKFLSILGEAYSKLGDAIKANDYYQQLSASAQKLKNRPDELEVLSSLSVAYRNQGNYVKAIEYAQQKLTLARELKDRREEGIAQGNLGAVYNDLADYIEAIKYHQQSLTIARELKDRREEAASLGELGIAYLELGEYAKAIDCYQQFLAISRELKDKRNEGVALGELGIVYTKLGDNTKAIEYYQQSLALARELKEPITEMNALGNLASAYLLLGNYAKAVESVQQSLEMARRLKAPLSEGHGLSILGLALYKSGKLAEAEKTLFNGIQVWESLRAGLGNNDAHKVSIFESQTFTYSNLQQVLIAQNKTDAALEISERGRARAFVELLTRRLSPQSNTPPPIEYPSLDEIKTIAQQQNATLVEYSIVSDGLYIWVVSPNGKVTFRTVDLKSLRTTVGGSSLRKLVTQTLESLGVGEDRDGMFQVTFPAADPERQTKSLKQLHQLLIQPIADLLPSDPNSHVIFIPHEDLFRVPFTALMDSDGKYLVEKHTILTAPSIQVLELTQQQQQNVSHSGQEALVVGNPSPMPTGFPPLKGAEKEANDVAQLLRTKPLIGSQATEPAVLQQLPNARIIHLATHGTFNEQQPLLGGVALAQTGKDTQNDGLLTAEEIFNLKRKLSAELLVLSACNTGRGRITGDGVIGLSRSFIAAGIPSVIVSLWSVPDAPTASLMTEFYTNLYQKKLDKAQALRMAMLKIMEKHRDNPRAWAAFTLIGEAE